MSKAITNQMMIYMEAKRRVEKIVIGLKNLNKHVKSTKQSRRAIKTMEDFIKCNITSDAISKKYEAVVSLLKEYSNVGNGQN